MRDMVTLETLLDIIPVLTLVIVGAYYSLQIRNQNKTRQAQLFMQLYDTYRSHDFRKLQMSLGKHEFTDFDDFWGKYGGDGDLDAWSAWLSVAAYYNGIGVLVKKGLISIDLVEELLGNTIARQWWRLGPILVGWRETRVTSQIRKHELMHGFEYLANEMHKRGTHIG
jgi:hypothetical protein